MTLVKRTNSLFPTFFDDFFTKEFHHGPAVHGSRQEARPAYTRPAVNISETDEAFVLEVVAPGYSKDNFSLELDGERLTVKATVEEATAKEGEEKNESKESNVKYTRREFRYGNFSRVFTVPEKLVDAENVSASYEGGLLTVSIPKLEEVKTKRSIAIA